MNETRSTFFQIKPSTKKNDYSLFCVRDRVVFMNDAFDLDDVKYITAVYKTGTMSFLFDVKVEDKVFTYDFERQAVALKAQRELTRAWCKSGEYEYVEEKSEGSTEHNMERT